MHSELIKQLRHPWGYNGLISELTDSAADIIEELSKRIPKIPHGRLIDADALIRDNGLKEIPEYHEVVLAAPTIIPAEEGEI